MIDIRNEQLITMPQAAALVPNRPSLMHLLAVAYPRRPRPQTGSRGLRQNAVHVDSRRCSDSRSIWAAPTPRPSARRPHVERAIARTSVS